MPRTGMMAIRKDALVNATISEIGRKGSLDVTVSQIAKAAGVSSALAHHYFGSKDHLLLAAMRAPCSTNAATPEPSKGSKSSSRTMRDITWA